MNSKDFLSQLLPHFYKMTAKNTLTVNLPLINNANFVKWLNLRYILTTFNLYKYIAIITTLNVPTIWLKINTQHTSTIIRIKTFKNVPGLLDTFSYAWVIQFVIHFTENDSEKYMYTLYIKGV